MELRTDDLTLHDDDDGDPGTPPILIHRQAVLDAVRDLLARV